MKKNFFTPKKRFYEFWKKTLSPFSPRKKKFSDMNDFLICYCPNKKKSIQKYEILIIFWIFSCSWLPAPDVNLLRVTKIALSTNRQFFDVNKTQYFFLNNKSQMLSWSIFTIKMAKMAFLTANSFFWCVFKNTEQKDICASIVFKTQ